MSFGILTFISTNISSAATWTCSDDCDAGGSTDICEIVDVSGDKHWAAT